MCRLPKLFTRLLTIAVIATALTSVAGYAYARNGATMCPGNVPNGCRIVGSFRCENCPNKICWSIDCK